MCRLEKLEKMWLFSFKDRASCYLFCTLLDCHGNVLWHNNNGGTLNNDVKMV